MCQEGGVGTALLPVQQTTSSECDTHSSETIYNFPNNSEAQY